MATPTKKAAPKKVAPKRQPSTTRIPLLASLKANEELRKEIEWLRDKLQLAERNQLKQPSLAEKPCPKCQILSIFEDLSESQINSVMRDVHDEVKQSRERRINKMRDEAILAKDRVLAFEADCSSNEAYN